MTKIYDEHLNWLVEDPAKYIYYSDLLEIKSFAESLVSKTEIISDVDRLKNFNHTDSDICFHLNVRKENILFSENGESEEDVNDGSRKESDWYFLKILDSAKDESISDFVKEKYKGLISKILSVPDLKYATLQVWSNDLLIDRHVDDNSVTVVMILNPDENKGCTLTIEDESHDLKNYKVFCFNGDHIHQLWNQSGSDVTALILRITHDKFELVS